MLADKAPGIAARAWRQYHRAEHEQCMLSYRYLGEPQRACVG